MKHINKLIWKANEWWCMNGLGKNWDLNWRYNPIVFTSKTFFNVLRGAAKRGDLRWCRAVRYPFMLGTEHNVRGSNRRVCIIEAEVSVKIPQEEINWFSDNLRLFSLKLAFSHADPGTPSAAWNSNGVETQRIPNPPAL